MKHGTITTLLLGALSAAATAQSFLDTEVLPDGTIRLMAAADPFNYYVLEDSEDLFGYAALELALADDATIWDVPVAQQGRPSAFLRVRRSSVFTPLDSDGDFIDDIYEMRHPVLDPIDPSDALLDPDRNGLTYLQEYLRDLFDTDSVQFYSREVTAFNFGARVESALSREWTAFNFREASAAVEAISAEISVYNGSGPLPYPPMPQALSRELTLYNLGSPSAPVEAVSAEISVYNGSGPLPYPPMPQALSRELTLFNFREPTAAVEATSRELSVFALTPEN